MVRLQRFPEYRRSLLPDPEPDGLLPDTPQWQELVNCYYWFRNFSQKHPDPAALAPLAEKWWYYRAAEKAEYALALNLLFPADKYQAETNRLSYFLHESAVRNIMGTLPPVDFLSPLFSLVWPHRSSFLFQISFLSTHLQTHFWPAQIRQYWHGLSTRLANTVLSHNEGWFLCEEAESLMEQADREQGNFLIDQVFYTKISDPPAGKRFGKLAGVALSDAAVPNGLVIAGNWYVPVDLALRDDIVHSGRLPGANNIEIGWGKWALIRPYNYGENPELIEQRLSHWRGGQKR